MIEPYDVMVENTLKNLKVLCAWHPKFFGAEKVMREAALGWEQEGVSHGICEECRAKLLARERRWPEPEEARPFYVPMGKPGISPKMRNIGVGLLVAAALLMVLLFGAR